MFCIAGMMVTMMIRAAAILVPEFHFPEMNLVSKPLTQDRKGISVWNMLWQGSTGLD